MERRWHGFHLPESQKSDRRGTTELKGPDNFVQWKRSLRTKFASQGFIEYLKKEPSKILEESKARVVVNSTPITTEQSEAQRRRLQV
jgi:hypothetical protein